jgi:hypothetical protein
VEFRQRGWLTEGVLNLLADHGVAPALSDGKWVPRRWMLSLADRFAARAPAPFAYVRWMGPNRDLVDHSRIQVDRSRELGLWAQAVTAMTRAAAGVREVYGLREQPLGGAQPRQHARAPAAARPAPGRARGARRPALAPVAGASAPGPPQLPAPHPATPRHA